MVMDWDRGFVPDFMLKIGYFLFVVIVLHQRAQRAAFPVISAQSASVFVVIVMTERVRRWLGGLPIIRRFGGADHLNLLRRRFVRMERAEIAEVAVVGPRFAESRPLSFGALFGGFLVALLLMDGVVGGVLFLRGPRPLLFFVDGHR